MPTSRRLSLHSKGSGSNDSCMYSSVAAIAAISAVKMLQVVGHLIYSCRTTMALFPRRRATATAAHRAVTEASTKSRCKGAPRAKLANLGLESRFRYTSRSIGRCCTDDARSTKLASPPLSLRTNPKSSVFEEYIFHQEWPSTSPVPTC